MTPQSELEIQGNFLAHPFAEILTEIAQARLNGSLRISDGDKKCVIYFKGGRVVFAVSNSRSARLYEMLLRRNRLKKEDIAQIPNFANDIEFAAFLQDKNFLTREECDKLFTEQIEEIIVDILSWPAGEWTFSSLARIRDGLGYDVHTTRLLIDFGRCMPVDKMLNRFRSLDERFTRSGKSEIGIGLKPEEAFVLSRAIDGQLTASDLVSVAAMSEASALHSIYTLWLGGLLIRNDWQPAIPESAVTAMRNAKLELRIEAKVAGVVAPAVKETVQTDPGKKPQATPEKQPAAIITLEEYLARVENAETYYDILGVDSKADIGELKQAYFGLAKMFHPDRYHSEGGELLKRIQHAFTELAQAHETLKSAESRELYDYRMRKEIADRERHRAAGNVGNGSLQLEQAAENFDRGFTLLMDEDFQAATPFLARAVHFAPKNARYHAYYGKALSADGTQRYKAEAELQAALKIDPNNPTFRVLLAEFFIQNNLKKRAEGELTRLLAVFPSNREARDLLDSLQS